MGGVSSDVTEKSQPAERAGETGDTQPAAPPPPKRSKLKSVRDMVLSMAVITAVSFGLYLLAPGRDAGADPVKEIGYQTEADLAARAAPYELLVPEGLSEEWRATSVRYRATDPLGATWKLGFTDPDNEFAGLIQADGDPATVIPGATQGAEDTGESITLGGREWTWYEGTPYNALVLAGDEATAVVAGTAPRERLTEFAEALRPVTAP